MGIIRVAGLDPAFAHFGVARATFDTDTGGIVVDRIRTIETEPRTEKTVRKNSDDLRRATELFEAMHEEVDDCDVLFAEIPSGAQHARSALGFGVALGVLASCHAPVIQVMPLETKLASVGSKTATKPEIISWAAGLYPDLEWKRYASSSKKGTKSRNAGDLHDDNEHAADACAIIYAGVNTPEFKQLMRLIQSTQKTG